MVKIPEDVMAFLKTHLAFVATVDARGMPNVVPKGEIAVINDDSIAFADLYSHQTKNNLINNPHIAILMLNPASYTGYQLKGKAKIIEHGRVYDALAKEALGEGQLSHAEAKYAVKMKVNKIIDIGYTHTSEKEIGKTHAKNRNI